MKHFIVIATLFVLFVSQTDARKCRALAMSGAGSMGAYQAAVIQGLTNFVPYPELNLTWDVITGVSAGSLNALGMSVFAPEDVDGGAEFLIALWNSIPNYNAFGNWPGGILEGLFFQGGLFTLAPGIEWVSDQIGDKTVKRKVSFAAVDSVDAEYVVYDYNATYTQPDDIIEVAFASSSIPVAFPPVLKDGRVLVDGGSVWNLDVPSTIRRCREIVEDDTDIIVDFIIVGTYNRDPVPNINKYRTLDNYMRSEQIKGFYNNMNDYDSFKRMYPNVNFRYIISNSESISTAPLPLDFSQAQVDLCYKVGFKDAENAAKLGPGVYGDILSDFAKRLYSGEDVNLNDMINKKLEEMEANKLTTI